MPLDLKRYVTEVRDYPKPGVGFKDLSPMLASPAAFEEAVSCITAPYRGGRVEMVLAAEARGFLWGAAVARLLGAGLVPARKPGKLPRKTVKATYQLEYGSDELHVHADALKAGQRVLLVDDVLATGGTAEAMVGLARTLEAEIVGLAFVVELSFLSGRGRLGGFPVTAAITYGS